LPESPTWHDHCNLSGPTGRERRFATQGSAGAERRGAIMKVCIIGASGKLGKYMVRHALERGYEVVGVCREKSVHKLDEFAGRIEIVPGRTNDREVIRRAVRGCDGVLTVLVPWGVHGYSSGTAQAVLDYAEPEARLVFSCGWHYGEAPVMWSGARKVASDQTFATTACA
jgi:hypothetical protein